MAIVGHNGCLNVFSREGHLRVNYTGNSWLVTPKSIGGSQPLLWPCSFITTDPSITESPPYLNTGQLFSHELTASSDPNTYAGYAGKNSGHLAGSWARLSSEDANIPSDARIVFAGLIGSGSLGPLNFQPYKLKITDPKSQTTLCEQSRQGHIIASHTSFNTECCWFDDITKLISPLLLDGDFELNLDLSTLSKIMPRRCHGWVLFVVYEHASFPYELVDIFAQTQARKPSTQRRQIPSMAHLKNVYLSVASGHVDRNSGGYIYLDLGDHTLPLSGPNNRSDYFSNGRRYTPLGKQMTTGSFGHLTPAPDLPNTISDMPFVGTFSLTQVDLTQAFKSTPHLRSETCIPCKITNVIGFALEQEIESPYGTCDIQLSSSTLAVGQSVSCSVTYTAGRGGMNNIQLMLSLPSSLSLDAPHHSPIVLPPLKPLESGSTTFTLTAKQINNLASIKLAFEYDLQNSSQQLHPHTLSCEASLRIHSKAQLEYVFTSTQESITEAGPISYTLTLKNIGSGTANKITLLFSLPLHLAGCLSFANDSVVFDGPHTRTHFYPNDNLLTAEIDHIDPGQSLTLTYVLMLTLPCYHLSSKQNLLTHLAITYFNSVTPEPISTESLLTQCLACTHITLQVFAPPKLFVNEWFDYTINIEHLGNTPLSTAQLTLDAPFHIFKETLPLLLPPIEPYSSDLVTLTAKASQQAYDCSAQLIARLTDESGKILCESAPLTPSFSLPPFIKESSLPLSYSYQTTHTSYLLGEVATFILDLINPSDYLLDELYLSHFVPEHCKLLDDLSNELVPLEPHSRHQLILQAQLLSPPPDQPTQATLHYHFNDGEDHQEYLLLQLTSPPIISPYLELKTTYQDNLLDQTHYTHTITLNNLSDIAIDRIDLSLILPHNLRFIPETLVLSEPKYFRCSNSGQITLQQLAPHETLTIYFSLYPTDSLESTHYLASVKGTFSIIHPDTSKYYSYILSEQPISFNFNTQKGD